MKKHLVGPLGLLGRLALGTILITTAIHTQSNATLYAQSIVGRGLQVQRLSGTVTTRLNRSQRTRTGDRLSAVGHGITTGRGASAILAIDTGVGSVAVAQNTQMTVQRLETLSDGARVTILDVPRGQARLQVRPFTHANSRLELHTPSGIAAVRGTEFGVAVAEDGTTIVSTLEGKVDATAQSITVPVEAGMVSMIHPGYPPSPARELDRDLEIQWKTQERRSNRLYVSGYVDATNSLSIEEQEIPISRTGYFETNLSLRQRNRIIAVSVKNALGEAREHRLVTWQINDFDR